MRTPSTSLDSSGSCNWPLAAHTVYHKRCVDWTLVSVVVEISSMNSRVVTCCWPDSVVGPLVSLCADNTNIVIVSANRITLRVQPVMMPFSNFRNSVVKLSVVNLILTSS